MAGLVDGDELGERFFRHRANKYLWLRKLWDGPGNYATVTQTSELFYERNLLECDDFGEYEDLVNVSCNDGVVLEVHKDDEVLWSTFEEG